MRPPASKSVSILLALLAFLFASLASAASYPFRVERIELNGGAVLYVVNEGPATADPLTLDLDGDGIETVGINSSSPVMFDITATGIQQSVGWVGADDGFLVRDLNGNGLIDSGAELFGDATQLSGGLTAADGFAALADLDVDTFTLQLTDSLPVSEAMNDGFWKTTLRRKA